MTQQRFRRTSRNARPCGHPSLIALMTLAGTACANENWPAWRGPNGNSVSDSTGVPVTWNASENIVWKAELPSWSGSTPIIWGDRVFVLSPSKVAAAPEPEPAQEPQAEEPGQRRRGGFGGGRGGGGRDPGGQELLLLCFSKSDGQLLWQHQLDEGNRLWRKGNNTSPSPVTDGRHAWTVTGNGQVTALTMTGDVVWKRNLQEDYGQFGLNWGYGSSPLLHDGKLIIEVLHGNNTDDPSYLVALDTATGKPLWRIERPTDAVRESPDAYTTPALLETGSGNQIVVSGGDYVTGHDPATGRELWRSAGLNPRKASNYRIIASPTVAHGMIYAPTRNRPFLALKPGGSGDISESHLAWKYENDGAPDVPSPVSDGKHLFMVSDNGMVTCLDAMSGDLIWGPERTVTGIVSSSPVLVDGKLLFVNESAVTVVLEAGPQFKQLAVNELDGTYTLSSIAVAGKRLFIRTASHLYCIGK